MATVDIESTPNDTCATANTYLTLIQTLRRALQCPCMKLCLREYFDKGRATQLLKAPGGVLSDDHRQKLKRFLKQAKRDPVDGRWCVDTSYDFSTKRSPACKEQGLGRVYADNSVGQLPTDIRNYIVTDVVDVDVQMSHPTMLLHVCKEAGIECMANCLKEYVESRDQVLQRIGQDYELLTYKEQKQAVNVVLNGGSPPPAKQTQGINFLHRLHKEAKLIGSNLMSEPQYAPQAALAKTMKGRVSFLHFVMTHKELEVLVEIAASFLRRGHSVRSLIYDGVHVERPQQGSIDKELLKQVEGDVLANTGCSIKLAVKAMESCFTKQLVADDEQLIDDDFAAETFVGAYGTENFKLCEGSIYLFNKKTGQWDNSQRALQASVHTHKKQLVFSHGDDTPVFNYGGDATRVSKMLSMVPNHIEEDNTFFLTNINTSQGKLLFSDGIYDFDTDSFTKGFDPEVVFRGRIARSFNRNPDPEIKKEVHKFMFEDPYTKQQLDEHVPLCEQIAYARALWGDYLSRQFYFLVGGTSTGKGVRTIALKQSCGSFVGEFNINNFVYNPNNGADEAKQLSWLLPIVHTRIALSNEARSQNTRIGIG